MMARSAIAQHGVAGMAMLLLVSGLPAIATAATVVVTTLADSGSGSLRSAVAAATAGDTVQITAAGTLTLTGGEIAIAKNLNISGPGSDRLTISGNGSSRIFSIIDTTNGADAPVTISGLTLSRGVASGTCPTPDAGSGGAIVATESLTLTDVVFNGNSAVRNGGGLAWAMRRSGQTLTLANTKFVANTVGCPAATSLAQGGGLYVGYDSTLGTGAASIVNISNSVFSNNTAVRSGGGIAIGAPATVSINGTRIFGNTASNAYGGGLYVAHPAKTGLTTASVIIQSSEIAANTAALAGGGASQVNSAAAAQTQATESVLALVNTTVSSNSVTGGSGNAAGISVAGNVSLSLDNSTIAFNSLGAAASGASITRSACTVSSGGAATREPVHSIDSSIVAMTNSGAAAYFDLSNAGATFASAWPVNTSLIRRSDGALTGAGNWTDTDPQLLALAFNGGATRTHALTPASPAIDTGSNSLALSSDQRGTGFARTYGATVDMGAFEYNPLIVTVAEFYNGALDAYFISGRPAEQYALDSVAGFSRTGATFQGKSALATDLTAAEDSVCRYYISAVTPYTSSHFYGFRATDCATIAAAVAAGTVTGFANEGYDFASYKPVTATTCPASAPVPVYRSFRAAANGKTPNHRYTTSTTVLGTMTVQGWASEGVAFCTTAAATVQ